MQPAVGQKRPKPFSAKQKKAQLQAKRERKRAEREGEDREGEEDKAETKTVPPLDKHFVRGMGKEGEEGEREKKKEKENERSRLVSSFRKLSKRDIENGTTASQEPLDPSKLGKVEVSFEDVYPTVLPFPKRPTWAKGESKEELEEKEKLYFDEWLDGLYKEYDGKALSLFEHNLEVWRQLWRVLEISDILLFIVDVRHPVLHFPPALYVHVCVELGKPLVVVLNKADLVTRERVLAWKGYLEGRFPGVSVVWFASFTQGGDILDDTQLESLRRRYKRAKEKRGSAEGGVRLLEACKAGLEADDAGWTEKGWWESSWSEAIREAGTRERKTEEEEGGDVSEEEGEAKEGRKKDDKEGEREEHQEDREKGVRRDYVTIGMIGHPNVGKSRLINRLMGRSAVSSSRTPGHTKHFQTLHLTRHIRLCDGPGLVFPSLLPRPLQVISGMYNLAQVQEPYTSVQYLAERVPIQVILGLGKKGEVWSAYDICEAFAIEHGMMTARNSRPDAWRAANRILRFANDGKLLLAFAPPLEEPGASEWMEKLRLAEE